MSSRPGVLLDTQVLLWCLTGSSLLGDRTRSLIDAEGPLYFSAVSIAEVSLKTSLGKLTTPPDLTERLGALGFWELPLSARAAKDIARYPALYRHDPFDRLLLAQASERSLWFETADERILNLGIPEVRDARSA